MKKSGKILLIVALNMLLISFAEGGMMMHTPYGDYCPKCSEYGVCPDSLSIGESREAVQSYFKGSQVKIGRLSGKGRFLKMELLKHDKIYDVILFDRKTGRIRSIY